MTLSRETQEKYKKEKTKKIVKYKNLKNINAVYMYILLGNVVETLYDWKLKPKLVDQVKMYECDCYECEYWRDYIAKKSSKKIFFRLV